MSYQHHASAASTQPDWPTSSADLYAPAAQQSQQQQQPLGDWTAAANALGNEFSDLHAVVESSLTPINVHEVHHQQQEVAPPPAAKTGKVAKSRKSKSAVSVNNNNGDGGGAADFGGPAGDNFEVVICMGPNTVLPKNRSTIERRYICNGQPIHRVTFWRHRKHGCPSNMPGEEGGAGEADVVVQPRPKRSRTSKADKNSSEPKVELLPHVDMSYHSHPQHLVDGMVDLAPPSHAFDVRSGFDMIAPGNHHANNGFIHMPTIHSDSSNDHRYTAFNNFVPPPPPPSSLAAAHSQGAPGMSSGNVNGIPSFSLMTDALNLYYAPYRSGELEDEEISSPIHTNYMNENHHYNSDRSEASDFMEHAADGVH